MILADTRADTLARRPGRADRAGGCRRIHGSFQPPTHSEFSRCVRRFPLPRPRILP